MRQIMRTSVYKYFSSSFVCLFVYLFLSIILSNESTNRILINTFTLLGKKVISRVRTKRVLLYLLQQHMINTHIISGVKLSEFSIHYNLDYPNTLGTLTG